MTENKVDPGALTERLVKAGETWADLNAAAAALEETKDAILSAILAEHFDQPEWKAKALARKDDRYTEHVGKMIKARQAANKARVRFDSGKAYVDLMRSAEASRRAEMNMGGR